VSDGVLAAAEADHHFQMKPLKVLITDFMKKLVYIKVYEGFLQARTYSAGNERVYRSEGLNHPRTLAGDFKKVEETFKKAISCQPKVLFGLIRPIVLIHLIPEMDGGYTDFELRFFREAALAGGASDVYLMTDKYGPLPDSKLEDVEKCF